MKRLLVILIPVLLAGCSPQIMVYSDHDPDYDVWTYQTFDWGHKINIEEGRNPLHYNELNDKRIKSAVEEEMYLRGYKLTSETPDLILHYHIVVDNQSVVTTEPYGYRYSQYWMRMETNIYPFREGTLILDLMDKKTSDLIWRGWAVAAVDQVDLGKVDQLIRTAVSRIFKKYPKGYMKTPTRHLRKALKGVVLN